MTDDIHPACALCKGACCESFAMQPRSMGWPDHVCQWMEYHGKVTEIGVEFEQPCSKLKSGLCSVYETRPKMCQDFKVGSTGCLHAVATRRTSQEAEIKALM